MQVPTNKLPEVDFSSVLTSDAALHDWLSSLTAQGVCLVTNAPPSRDVVVKLANRIRGVQPTIYGETFDVETTPNAINVAYTSVALELHQDIAYYQSIPGLQLLHCLRFDATVTGGRSTYADLFAAAEKLRTEDRAAFDALASVPITFQKVRLVVDCFVL